MLGLGGCGCGCVGVGVGVVWVWCISMSPYCMLDGVRKVVGTYSI